IMKKILIPIDGSPLSVKVGESAVKLGKLINAELIFITVINMPSEEKYEHFGMTVENQFSANRKEMLNKLMQQESRMLNIIVRNLDTVDLKVTQKLLVGRSAAEILKFAEEEYVDYIFMGRRGFSPVQRFFVGSVTQKVISAAPCPVIVING
ncbi:MAG TPA: universal stress protein, partial [Sedimentibacter sp.]|nr:universal stress protein [Sedimentibacter sp.]